MALPSFIEPKGTLLAQLGRLAWAETMHPDGYLADLSEQLVRLLAVDLAVIGAVDNARKSYRTLFSYSASQGRLSNFEQELLGSVASEVKTDAYLVASGASDRFPLDWVLREHRVEGYLGLPLLGASGDRLGLVAIYHSVELAFEPSIVARLEVIAQRAAAELGLHRAARPKQVNSLVVRATGTIPPSGNGESSSPLSDGEGNLDADEVPWSSRVTLTEEPGYRRFFELGAVGMALVGLNGEFIDVNESLCSLLKRDRCSVLRAKWSDYCIPEELSRQRRLLIEIAEGKSDGFSADMSLSLPDGGVVPASVVMRCVRRADGRVDYLTLLVHDLTPRRRIEEQLMHSQRLEAVGRLAGGIAHDFNNLLTAILAHTESVRHVDEPAVIEMTDGVRDAAVRAAKLTNQLLAFARRQVVEPKVLDLNRVVSATIEMLERMVGEDVEVTSGISSDLWKVRIDPGQLEQILVNLTVNARDAMPNGGRLLVGAANLPREQVAAALGAEVELVDYVSIIVADTGEGMNKDAMAHLFEPFFTTKEAGKGSGLGLATCLGIVSQNKGQIRVHSTAGVGTTVRIYFPRYHSDVASAPSVPPSLPDAATNETILLVEDDDMVRRVAVRVLRSRGLRVMAAASGHEALEVAAKHEGPIDLLLTDLVMPKMSGDKLAQQLGPLRPEMRILFTSGYAETAHDHGLEPGSNFLQKPYTPRQLTERIRKILDRDPATPSLPSLPAN